MYDADALCLLSANANLTNAEMAQLYNHPKIKAMVTLTNGEGFCRPLLEAAACGLPVMATNWSGQLDFLNKANAPSKLKFSPVYSGKSFFSSVCAYDVEIQIGRAHV